MLGDLSTDQDIDELIEESALPVNRSIQHVYECSVPTVAVLDGAAFGAGYAADSAEQADSA